jgi:hypothetical protein
MCVLVNDLRSAGATSSWERLRALKRIVPKAAIRKSLQSSRRRHRHCRAVPREVVVWFVIALALFCRDSYRQVFRWLARFRDIRVPARSTLCEARRSIGPAPLRWLAHTVIELLGTPQMPQVFYAGMRLMAIDGFIVDLRDTAANERAFGRPGSGRSPGAFPQARVVSLCEVGTHVLWRSLIKPLARGEVPMARVLLQFLQKNMLLLWDRGFLSYDLVQLVLKRQAQLLARIKRNVVVVPFRRLPDGSYLGRLYRCASDRQRDRYGVVVRIIEYTFSDPDRPGSGQRHRLLTTLLSSAEHPAARLIVLYHDRWEEELAIDELKTHQRDQRLTLRSETPAGVVQELYGLLLAHYVVRKLMCAAAAGEGIAPRQMSFVNTLKILRCRLPECPRSARGIGRWYADLLKEIASERLEPRRNRINPRVIKRQVSPWPKKREIHRAIPQPQHEFDRSIVMLN